ncbi:hypothetical protein AVEN_41241-1 [Araneus ventricosus]|uniref:Uncharacterized protein n=1 Tax=Araneus ventricosus TaxID=182803 RepID=A0A4Y2SYI1_ARAVE|nr:hypothetical protein AVEN_8568-1 [Araneus ventricosus]GBN91945.1 hypothetical protein AVEN_41241-1 [Araneus ventricosus]
MRRGNDASVRIQTGNKSPTTQVYRLKTDHGNSALRERRGKMSDMLRSGHPSFDQQRKWRKRKAKTKKEDRKYMNKQEIHKSELFGKQPKQASKFADSANSKASEDEANIFSY